MTTDDVRAAAPTRRRLFDLKQKFFADGLTAAEVCELIDALRALDEPAPADAGPDLERLASIAEKATPGPWISAPLEIARPRQRLVAQCCGQDVLTRDNFVYPTNASGESHDPYEDPQYIAAFDPPTVKSLLALARRGRDAEREVERLNGWIGGVESAYSKQIDLVKEVERLRERLRRLEEAARPFAAVGESIPDNWPAGCSVIWETMPNGHDRMLCARHGQTVGPTVAAYHNIAALVPAPEVTKP